MIRCNHNKRINLSKSVFFFHRCCEKSLKIPVFLYLYCGFWLFQQYCCGQPRLAAGVTGTSRIRAGRSGPRGQESTHQESREGKRKGGGKWKWYGRKGPASLTHGDGGEGREERMRAERWHVQTGRGRRDGRETEEKGEWSEARCWSATLTLQTIAGPGLWICERACVCAPVGEGGWAGPALPDGVKAARTTNKTIHYTAENSLISLISATINKSKTRGLDDWSKCFPKGRGTSCSLWSAVKRKKQNLSPYLTSNTLSSPLMLFQPSIPTVHPKWGSGWASFHFVACVSGHVPQMSSSKDHHLTHVINLPIN